MDAVSAGANAFTTTKEFLPTHTFEKAPHLHLLLLAPGGFARFGWILSSASNNVDGYIDYMRRASRGYQRRRYRPLTYFMSNYSGSILLAKAGILDGRKAMTNTDFYCDMAKLGLKTHWLRLAR